MGNLFKIKTVYVLSVSLLICLAYIFIIHTSEASLKDSSATSSKDEMLNDFQLVSKKDLAMEPQKELLVKFVNNAYSVDSSYNLKLILNNTYIVYDGKFSRFLNLKLPLNTIKVDKNTEVSFLLSKNGYFYRFRTMQTCKFEKSNDILEIVFIPKGDDYFMFYFTFVDSDKHTY